MTNRRQFLCRTGGIMTAGATLGLAPVHAAAPDQTGVADIPHDHYLLTDVLLETGVERDGDTVVGTRTQTHTLEIRGGRIAAIHDAPTGTLPRYSACLLYTSPSPRD